MTTTGHNLDQTVDEMDTWIKGVMRTLETDNRQRAYQALEGTLPAIRQRLDSDSASYLGRQLPVLVRGLYFNDPESAHANAGDAEELERFFATVRAPFSANLRIDTHAIAAAVFQLLEEKLDEETTAEIRAELPRDLQRLWQTAGDATPPAVADPDELH